MKKLARSIALASIAGAFLFTTANLTAQQQQRQRGGQGGFGDPAQFQQMMLERYQEALSMSADEFKAVQPLIETVMTKQREVTAGRINAFGRGGRGQGGDNQGGGRGRGFGGTPSPEAEALQKAVESGTSSEIKVKLETYREARKKKEAELKDARENLRKVLTVKQEAQSVVMGLLD